MAKLNLPRSLALRTIAIVTSSVLIYRRHIGHSEFSICVEHAVQIRWPHFYGEKAAVTLASMHATGSPSRFLGRNCLWIRFTE